MPRQLILFPCSHMGNLLIALPHLKAMLDDQEECLLVIDQRYQSIIAMALPGETRVLWYPDAELASHKPLLHRARHYLRFLRALRRFGAEHSVDIEGEQKSATLSLLSGAATRHGPTRRHSRWFYSHSHGADFSGHRWLGYASLSLPAADTPANYLPLNATRAGQQDIAQHPLQPTQQPRPILIHPGATKTYKMWHPEQFASLCQRLRRLGATPILIGAGAKDRAQIERIQTFLCEPAMNLCDQLSLEALVALMQQSQGYVGNDSGPMHLAAACGLATVGLFGPTNDTLWSPLSRRATVLRQRQCHSQCQRNSCVMDSYPCLQGITVDRVIATLESLGALDGNQAACGHHRPTVMR